MTNNFTDGHSPEATERIHRAHAEAYRLADSAPACIELFERVGLPLVAPEKRAQARQMFRQGAEDPRFRAQFALWAYQGTLQLYEDGALE